jgi:hypothetical protein
MILKIRKEGTSEEKGEKPQKKADDPMGELRGEKE